MSGEEGKGWMIWRREGRRGREGANWERDRASEKS